MNRDKGKILLSDAVYLDTNVLIDLSHGDTSVDFIELRSLLELHHVGLFVPETVVKEFIQYRIKDTLDQIERLKAASRKIGRLLGRDPLSHEEPQDVEATINEKMMNYLRDTGIEMVKTPDIPLETLIDMAVKKQPPFEEKGEKGFRDAVILFSIIDHMKTNIFSDAILVSVDPIFNHKEIIDRFKEKGQNVLIGKSFAEAKDQVKRQMDANLRVQGTQRKKDIKSFLNTQFETISDYVLKNAGSTEDFLKGEFLASGTFSGAIKKVLAIRPREISDAICGYLKKSEPPEEGCESITFSVSTELDLLVEQHGMLTALAKRPRFKLSAPEGLEKLRSGYPESALRQITVVRYINIEARVSKDNDHYSKIKLLRIISN
jgi:predicted nucleic acid-binding protein